MAQTDDERLLGLLEPKADAPLPAGYRWGRLADAGIFGPLAEFKSVRRGGRVVKLPTPESIAAQRYYETLRFPVIDRNSPDAVAAWEALAAQTVEYHKSLKQQPSEATAEPESKGDDAPVSSRKFVVRR